MTTITDLGKIITEKTIDVRKIDFSVDLSSSFTALVASSSPTCIDRTFSLDLTSSRNRSTFEIKTIEHCDRALKHSFILI